MKNKCMQGGFTLLELSTVVAIISILCAIAIPQFGAYTGRARNSEAGVILGSIASSQMHHKLRTGVYVACPPNPVAPGGTWDAGMPEWNRIGFRISGKLYFQYEVLADETGFVAYARDGTSIWEISSSNLNPTRR